jgi:uncharacterized protein (DUF4415 family)
MNDTSIEIAWDEDDVRNLPEDFWEKAKPAREFFTAQWGAANAEIFLEENRRSIGQRGKQKAPVKEKVTVRLDADILDGFRATGKGWQTRMNDVLRAHPPV